MNAQVDSAPQRESDFRPRRGGDSESRDTGSDDAHSRARISAGDIFREAVFHDLGTSRSLSMLPHTAALGDTPGYRLPQVIVGERGDRDDRAENTIRLGGRDQTAGPFRSVDSAAARQYLHGDGATIPPIARDFHAHGLRTLRDQDARDEQNPNKIYVSTRPGNRAEALGSAANPYTSIQSAVDHAPKGSVLEVMRNGNDVYRERVNVNRSDITIRTDPKNPAVIDLGNGSRGSVDAAFNIGSGISNVGIKNFEIRNFSSVEAAIKVDGSNIRNITIAGNDIHSANGSEAIRVAGRGGTEESKLSGINVISNTVHDLRLKQSEAIPINGNVDGFKVAGNIGYRMNNLFIDAIGGEGKSPNRELDQARGGIIEYNFADGISTTRNGSYGNQPSSAGIYSDGAKDVTIRNNYIRNSDYGLEITTENPGRVKSVDVKAYGNIIENSKESWLIRGGGDKVQGGYANDNLVIGNTSTEVQGRGGNFGAAGNAAFKNLNGVDKLPTPVANLMEGKRTEARPPVETAGQIGGQSPFRLGGPAEATQLPPAGRWPELPPRGRWPELPPRNSAADISAGNIATDVPARGRWPELPPRSAPLERPYIPERPNVAGKSEFDPERPSLAGMPPMEELLARARADGSLRPDTGTVDGARQAWMRPQVGELPIQFTSVNRQRPVETASVGERGTEQTPTPDGAVERKAYAPRMIGNNMAMMGPPSITPEKIDQVLKSYGSPATGLGKYIYDKGVEKGMNPAVMLAFYVQESSCGTKGVARHTNSIGNIKGKGPDGEKYKGFAVYKDLKQGVDAWYDLIKNKYVPSGRQSVDRVVPKYAPRSDGNNVGGYIRGVNRNVTNWAHASGVSPTEMQREKASRNGRGRETEGEPSSRRERGSRRDRGEPGERAERPERGPRDEGHHGRRGSRRHERQHERSAPAYEGGRRRTRGSRAEVEPTRLAAAEDAPTEVPERALRTDQRIEAPLPPGRDRADLPKALDPVTDPHIVNDIPSRGNGRKVDPVYIGYTGTISYKDAHGRKQTADGQPLWADRPTAQAILLANEMLAEKGKRIQLASESTGPHDHSSQLNSAGRTMTQQKIATGLHAHGISNHNLGAALDIRNHDDPDVRRALKAVGFIQGDSRGPIAGDEWHWSIPASSQRRVEALWRARQTQYTDR